MSVSHCLYCLDATTCNNATHDSSMHNNSMYDFSMYDFSHRRLGPCGPAARSAGSSGGRRRAARQRIVGVLVQSADSIRVESLLLHFEVGTDQQIRRQLLDGKTDGFRRLGESPVAHRAVALAAARGEQLGRGRVVEGIHVLILGYSRKRALVRRPSPPLNDVV